MRFAPWILAAGAPALVLGSCAREVASTDDRRPPFLGRVQRFVPGRPEGLCAADLDGDGWTDLAVAMQASESLLVWRGSPTGLEREPRAIQVGGWALRPIALPPGSFGAPAGARPLAVASREQRCVGVYDATGGAEQPPLLRIDLDSAPRALAARGSDLLIATNSEVRQVIGSGTSARTEVRLPVRGAFPRCALATEAGAVVGFQDPPSIVLFRFTGNDPRDEPSTRQLEGIPRDLAQLDADGDGDLELVVAGGADRLWVFGAGRVSGGDGVAAWFDGEPPLAIRTAHVPLALATGVQGTSVAALAHFDLDFSIRDPRGEPPWRELSSGYAGQSPIDLAFGDFDGDRAIDLAISNRDAGAVSFVLAGKDGRIAANANVPAGDFPVSIDCGDLNGDGRGDAVVACARGASLAVLLGGESGLRPAGLVATGPAPTAVRFAGLDRDGRAEVACLWSDATGTRLAVRRARADGALETADPAADRRVARGAGDLLVLDLDGDPERDFLVADPEAGEVVWVEGALVRRLAVPSAPRALEPIELDGDARPEIAVALGSPGPRVGIAFLDLAPDGAALEEVGFLPAGGRPLDLAARDFDGDGREDLALLAAEREHSVEGRVQLLLRSTPPARAVGPEDFRTLDPKPSGLMPHHLLARDVDGDGSIEIIVAAQNSHAVNLWRVERRKRGLELVRLDDLGAHLGCMDAALADIDGDGRLDLLVANAFSNDVSVLPGRGR